MTTLRPIDIERLQVLAGTRGDDSARAVRYSELMEMFGEMSTTVTTLNAVGARLTEALDNITTIQDDLSTTISDIGDLETDLSTATGRIDALEAQTFMASIQIGGLFPATTTNDWYGPGGEQIPVR